jgi:hypothetical protein
MVANNSGLGAGAKVLIAPDTGSALHAAARMPAHPDSLPGTQMMDLSTDRDHLANGLMSRHKRITTDTPIILENGQI